MVNRPFQVTRLVAEGGGSGAWEASPGTAPRLQLKAWRGVDRPLRCDDVETGRSGCGSCSASQAPRVSFPVLAAAVIGRETLEDRAAAQ